jgi:hypothetical protein
VILTEAQLLELTRKRRPSAQARVLGHAGIPFRARPDGSLIVLMIHVETIEGQPANARLPAEPVLQP